MFFVSADESSLTGSSVAIDTAQREKRLLDGIIQNLLPAVGPSVKSIVLAYSSTVSSKMVNGAESLLRLSNRPDYGHYA